MRASAVIVALGATLLATLLLGCFEGDIESGGAPSCAAGESHALVVTKLAFTREEPKGTAPGFDLDERVSDGNDTQTCGHADRVDPDGTPGIDNELSGIIPDIEALVGDAVDGLIQGAINNGELVILLEMQGVDSLDSDSCVDFATEIGDRSPPTLGTDGEIEAYQTYDLASKPSRSEVSGASIAGRVLTAGPFDLVIPLALFDVSFELNVHDARFRFVMDEEGRAVGSLGGGIVVDELIAGVSQGAGVEKYLPAMGVVLHAASDLAPNEDGKCQQLSVALDFAAVPAFVRE